MKAPDKIFLAPLLVEGCSKTLSRRVTTRDEVYIRRDYLLELLKKEIDFLDTLIEDENDPVWRGERFAFNQAANKLKNL